MRPEGIAQGRRILPDFSSQFLVLVAGLLIVLIEAALAEWGFFYAAAPMLSLCFLAWFVLMNPGHLPVFSILAMALFAEFLGLDELGVRVVCWLIAWQAFGWRRNGEQEPDFLSLWSFFAGLTLLLSVFRLLIYFIDRLSLPDLSALAVQTGFTIFLFPVIFVLLYWTGFVWERWTAVFTVKR